MNNIHKSTSWFDGKIAFVVEIQLNLEIESLPKMSEKEREKKSLISTMDFHELFQAIKNNW